MKHINKYLLIINKLKQTKFFFHYFIIKTFCPIVNTKEDINIYFLFINSTIKSVLINIFFIFSISLIFILIYREYNQLFCEFLTNNYNVYLINNN